MRWPSLSIVIPSYNQGKYIERTLLSILKQEYAGSVQVIVSDGGSTDETVAVLEKYPEITWWSARDKGFVDAVNKGLARATGEVLAIQSSDDFYLKDAFKITMDALEKDETLGVISGCDVRLNEDGVVAEFSPLESGEVDPAFVLLRHNLPQHCAFFRRAVLDKIGGLRPEVDRCADLDLWFRALHFFRGRCIPVYTGAYQLHPEQRTQSQAEVWIAAVQRVVDSCAEDETYARAFRLSAPQKRELMRRTELLYYGQAGGPNGHEKARAVAADILKNKRDYPADLVAYAGRTFRARMNARDKFLSSVKQGSLFRDMQNKRRRSANVNAPTVNLDWWRH